MLFFFLSLSPSLSLLSPIMRNKKASFMHRYYVNFGGWKFWESNKNLKRNRFYWRWQFFVCFFPFVIIIKIGNFYSSIRPRRIRKQPFLLIVNLNWRAFVFLLLTPTLHVVWSEWSFNKYYALAKPTSRLTTQKKVSIDHLPSTL